MKQIECPLRSSTWLHFVFIYLTLYIQYQSTCNTVEAIWPDQKPYVDICKGRNEFGCDFWKDKCVWSTDSYPICAEIKYSKAQPPNRNDQQSTISDRFFEFSPGVHLSEGADQQWWYNLSLDECASQCLRSASYNAKKYRCLSFDFYPFESPLTEAPYRETVRRGVCVLNSQTKDQARLRNEDQGATDAELLYKSHFTKRPFSELDGYYEVRDPRGGQIAKMLQYSGESEDFAVVGDMSKRITPLNIWPQTRWGLYHFYIPPPIQGKYFCNSGDPIGASDNDPSKVYFRAAFTPINLSQHCPGVMSKTAASNLCKSIGGDLCSATELNLISGKNIGCSYDGMPLWTSGGSFDSTQRKFVRCCVTYQLPSNCQLYSQSNLNFCAAFKTMSDCIQQGSGYSKQYTQGFGLLLDQMRDNCRSGKGTCSGLVNDWAPRDKCLWCLEPGSTDAGACYPGNDYGICPRATDNARKTFELKLKTYCPAVDVCKIALSYPHIAKDFDVPTKSPTPKPTKTPTKNPTKAPTRSPTATPTTSPTKKPTVSPTKAPTTPKPTRLPTTDPTRRPSLSPTATPISSPSASPLPNPTRAPMIEPTNSPTREITKSPSFTPTVRPTKLPSLNPTSKPTKLPTFTPTAKPITASTIKPTKLPTLNPTLKPSVGATTKPTKTPTANPVAQPTDGPTVNPTKSPTNVPTIRPTSDKTIIPTKQPTENPTIKPTKQPTDVPTVKPTKQPTEDPTKRPTKLPTFNPTTKSPSSGTTSKPTQRPTSTPTRRPTKLPTKNPTRRPTKSPTTNPTKRPTKLPTLNPTTKSPVSVATKNPTESPTNKPVESTSSPTTMPIQTTPSPTKMPTESVSVPTSSPEAVVTNSSGTL